MSHTIKHLIGCLVPLLLIFLLPAFGVSDGVSLLVFIVLMFACHLFMLRGHGHEHDNDQADQGGHNHGHH
ncbi:MAG: hypothetical protein HKN07_08050 [Acidimicrobiia bacterium]|nr:hypothetical protein [Acidimicrobiia bacterium]